MRDAALSDLCWICQDENTAQTSTLQSFDFHLPPNLEAGEPPEARGLSRDQVRLMVSDAGCDCIVHGLFSQLSDFLKPGDLLVINTSGTRSAAINATRAVDGLRLELHLSTHLPSDLWTVELRYPHAAGAKPFYQAVPGERLELPDGASVTLLTAYRADQRLPDAQDPRVRLWIADVRLPMPVDNYLEQHGFPIRYPYVRQSWPNSYYQTVYATEMGSAEMPSAGRAFTPELITRLVAKGIQFAPLILHTGVASLEDHEPPYEEYYRISPETARLVNATHTAGQRVIAVGTTVVRALETVARPGGKVSAGEGWTGLVITPSRGMSAVEGLLTGFHEPKSSHLAMLAALARPEHLQLAYREALEQQYLWHEFGDLHLLLNSRDRDRSGDPPPCK